MPQKYYIGPLEFKTKKECLTYTRNIINKLGCCIISKDHDYYNFFLDLINNHPECEFKIGVGIIFFYIRINPLFKKNYEIMIKRLDGSDIGFSWTYCCEFKERTSQFNLIKAMRYVIREDTIIFKKNNKLICNLCSKDNEVYENYHVDHNNPSFKLLKENFLKTQLEVPIYFDNCKITGYTIFKDVDEKFKRNWVEYHTTNCNLQILCRECNLKKPKD